MECGPSIYLHGKQSKSRQKTMSSSNTQESLTWKTQLIYPWSPSRSKRAFPWSKPRSALYTGASAGSLLLLNALSKQVDITRKRICFGKSYGSSWPDISKEN